MIRRIISWRLTRAEQMMGVPADYLRHILAVSLPAFLKFTRILPLASYRRKLPIDACNVGRLVATRHEDCGSCVQIVVNLARREGVSRETLQAVLDERPERLSPPLADVYRFTQEVVQASGGEEDYRERIRRHYGEEALIELAMAIASTRVFPTTKRALGYAKSCALVRVSV
jgi:alkylhydroperoxidase family enzyme